MPSAALPEDSLPEPEYRSLPRAALHLRRVGALLMVLPVVAAASLLLSTRFEGSGLAAIVAALWLLASMLALIWAQASWRRFGWALSDIGLHRRRGVFWQSETLVPRSRVQHTDIERGPLARRLGLAALKVYTAGTRHGSVEISGLDEASARELRDTLTPSGDDAL